MNIFRRWLGLALIVMALLLTACDASTPTPEPEATSPPDESAEASTGSEEHQDEDADAHEGEEEHEGEEADAHEGEEEHEGEDADAHEGEEEHEGEDADAHEGEDEHEGEDADAHEGEDEHEGEEDEHEHDDEDKHDEDAHEHEDEDEHAHEELPELEAVTLADGEMLRVVATTSIVGDVVTQIGGDAIDLTVLLAPGQDPHAYQASARDLATAAEADVIFVNGFSLEEGLLEDLENAAEDVPIVPVSAGIEPIAGEEEEEEEDEEDGHEHAHAEDPHVWFDVANVEQWTHNIATVLGQLDPEEADTYEANAETYEAELQELDDFVRESVSAIPATNRKLVTNHDSFGYFAKAYGFDIIGTVIPTSSTNAEPSASDLSELIETIKQEQVPAIFIDSGVSDELAQVVADETGAAVFALYTGALGEEGSEADSYLGMMRTNVERIEEGFGQDAIAHESEDADTHEEDEDEHDASREEADTHEHEEDEHAHEGLPELEAVTLADGEMLRVVATTSIVGDVVAQVGGDAIDLTVLLAPGQDPHAYQPSAQDLATAAQANVIFVNGFSLEEGLLSDLENAAEGVPIVPVSAGIEPIAGEEDEEEEEEEEEDGHNHAHAEDPHVWFDVANVEQWTHNIATVLGQLDPEEADTYEANAETYEAELKELDDFVRESVSAIPAANRKLVTNHDSFGYFANAYGFDIIGTVIPNLSTNAEPSASDLSELIETIKQEQVPAIFIDSSASDELAQVVADETGAAVFELYTGALGEEGSGADSYLGMMRTNVERIEEGFATVEVEEEVEVAATAEPVETPTSSSIAADGGKRLIINEVFWPNAGYAIETDDALPLSRWGIAETLVKIDFDGQMIPYLAESWTQTDETTWSFTLRSDVTFQNGEPFNAEAVVTAFNHLLSAETPPRGFEPENIVSIEAVDETTLIISTVEPDVLMPNRLSAPSFAILAPSAYESSPTDPYGTGTGPFILASEEPEQSVTLVKNEAYWGASVNLDEVLVLAAPDGDIRATMLQTGEVDIARHIPIPQIPLLETDPTLTLVRTAQPRTRTLYLNNVEGPLSDIEVRRAVLHAIDKQGIVDAILEGVGSVAAGPFAPSEAWVNSDLSADTFDPDLARELLTEAGYDEGELEIQIATYPSRAALPLSAIAIQQMLSDVGIVAEVRIAPYSALEPEVLAANFDIFIVSRGHLIDNYDPEGFLQADFSCEGSYNLSQYCNEEVDQLLDEARSTADSDARFDIYRQIQTIIVEEDVVNIFLNYTEQIYGYRDGVLNYQPHPLEYYTLTPELDIE